MKFITKAAICAGSLAGAYVSALNVVDNLLVKRKWTIPENMKELVSNADMSELIEKGTEYLNELLELPNEKHFIFSDRGEKLTGWLFKAEKESKVFLLGAHGYRSDGRGEFGGIAQYYIKKRGYNALLPDHTASGDSEGNIVGFGKFEAEDCIKWANYLIETFGDDITIILHGVSMGAATVMLMSGNEKLPPNVKMIVADCGYTSAADEFEFKLREMNLQKLPAIMPIVNALNKVKGKYDFYDTDANEAVAKAKVPMLFIHGSDDLFVPTYMSEQNYIACSSEIKDLLIVEGADHAQSYIVGKDEYEAKLDEFIQKVGI